MAFVSRRPGGGWTTVAPRTDYANVISNYASVIRQAQEEQSTTELESKVFAYKNGQLSYQDLKTYLTSRRSKELPGSQRELTLLQLDSQLDEFERDKNRDIQRSKMEVQFADNGLSAAERVQIEEALLGSYKEGTPEHTEQLSTIAAAKELRRVEGNNAKMAQIEAKLSDGGLTPNEQVQLYTEAQKLTEKGTPEYSDLAVKINNVKAQQREVDKKNKLVQVQSDLLDKYAEGGLTDEEKLTMNREMQKFVDKGTEDYVALKENEAALIEAAQNKAAGAGESASRKSAAIEFEKTQALLDAVEGKFQIGAIPEEEYLAGKEELLGTQNRIISNLGEAASEEETGQMQAELETFIDLKNKVKSGEAITVRAGGKQVLVPLKELSAYTTIEKVASLEQLNTEDGSVTGSEDRQIITVMENGKEVKYALTDDGKFEPLSTKTATDLVTGKEVLVGSGQKMDGATVSRKTRATEPGLTSEDSNFDPAVIKSFSPTTTSGSVLGSSSSGAKKTTNSSSSNKSSSGINLSPVTSTISKAVSSTSSFVKQAATAIKSSGPGNSYGNTPTGTVKPGSIKGTIDLGITEKLGVGKAINKAKSIISNLFKKK